MKKPTIADVAELAGVSKPTVSRYLKQENVKEDIAEKIQAAIEELGYVPRMSKKEEDGSANKKEEVKKQGKLKAKVKKVKPQKGYKIAVLVKNLQNFRTRNYLQALEAALYEYGCTFEIVVTHGRENLEEQYLTGFILKNVQAIIVESCSDVEFINKQMRTTAIPVIYLTQDSAQQTAMDETAAANVLAKYLLDKKHLVIRYLGSQESLTQRHLAGIKDAYHALKQPIDILPIASDGTYEMMFDKIKEMFAEEIDLLILQSDEMAIPLSKYLKEYHIAVPQNVSMISFGGTPIAKVISPALTTLTYDYEAYAAYIMECICALVEKKTLPEKKSFFQIEERDSVR